MYEILKHVSILLLTCFFILNREFPLLTALYQPVLAIYYKKAPANDRGLILFVTFCELFAILASIFVN